MPDDQVLPRPEALELDPAVGVPDPAPLDMPRRHLRLLPFDLTALMPGPPMLGRRPQE